MKVTKYPQSCLLLEKDGQRIVIDPGNFFAAKYGVKDLGQVDAVLYTHQHQDHYDQSIADQFKQAKVPLYGNESVCELIGSEEGLVKSGSGFTVAGFAIMPHDLPHFPVEGWELPQNTGYIIDGTFFDPGDGLETTGVSVLNLAGPLASSYGQDKVKELAKSVGAKRILPIHYTTDLFPTDVRAFKESAKDEFEIIVLDDGESAEF